MKNLFILFIWLFSSSWASADIKITGQTLHEAYYKLMLAGQHAGFYVQKIAYNDKTQKFYVAHFLKANQLAGNLQESLVGVSNKALNPLAYRYTKYDGQNIHVIDAQFKGLNMTAKIRKGNNVQDYNLKIPQGAFLSSFLSLMILQSPQGYAVGTKFSYNAIAEETAQVHRGDVFVKEMQDYKGIKGFRILNTFDQARFVSLINFKGEALFTQNPDVQLSAEMVANPTEATNGISYSNANLKLVFNEIPAGLTNDLARAQAPTTGSPANSATTDPAPTTPVPIGTPGKKKSK